jgi:ABC-type tungstate transport system permease subunit
MFASMPLAGLQPRTLRRALILAITALLSIFLLHPAGAKADTSSTLTVVGTSDVSDSGLVPNLIQPMFHSAFPGFTFKYVGSATGTAIKNAENGTGGPSALIVHAASLENQFVSGGFSYQNQYGHAIFINDFVLAGPNSDPGGVTANASNNVAQALADIATQGAAGKVTFLTRGGTSTASGTTVEEHKLWALVDSSGLKPSSLVLCTVSAPDGGGMSPISSTVQSTSGQPCPDSGTVNGTDAPSWYFVNAGANQAANVIATNACTHGSSGANTCYVLTDRGTFDYLHSGTDPAGSIPDLKVVTRNNSASAPGGANELINYFHVYIINPSKPGESVNLPAAQDFVNFLTSPAFQSQLKTYLPTGDPGGPPFIADASPNLTASGIPARYKAGKPVRVTGTLVNAEPGYPVLSGETVTVNRLVAGFPVALASAKTDSAGHYSVKFVPTATGSYTVSTSEISKIENAVLSPPYGDILSPASSTATHVTVHAKITKLTVKSQGGSALIVGKVAPGTGHVKGKVTVRARPLGSRHGFKKVATDRLGASDGNFAVAAGLAPGTWQIRVSYQDPKVVVATTARVIKVKVGPKPTSAVSLNSAKVHETALTVGGTVKPAGPAGAKVQLLALNTASSAPARFKTLKTVKVKTGKAKVTIDAKLRGASRWVLELKYIRNGQPSSFSKLRTVAVK